MNNYQTLSELRLTLPSGGVLCGGDIKFVAPDRPIDWALKLRTCLSGLQALSTLYRCMIPEREEYKFSLDVPFFCKKTTLKISYDYSSYTWFINPGFFLKDTIKHGNYVETVSEYMKCYYYHILYKKMFDELLLQMKSDLPSNKSKELLQTLNNEFGSKLF